MLYTEYGSFSCHAIANILSALKIAPTEYTVYAKHADSIYPITDFLPDAEGAVSFSSVETYGEIPPKTYLVGELRTKIHQTLLVHQLGLCADAYLEAADHVDPELDMQMIEPCEIRGWGIDSVCHMFFLEAGSCWDYV